MTTYSPTIRTIGSDRRAHTLTVSTKRRTLDRRQRSPFVRRQIGPDRTLIGAVFGGPGVISGNFDVAGAGRHIYVLLDNSHERIADGYADPVTGDFSFPGLLEGQRYTVILEDETGEYAPQIWSHVEPTV